MSYYILPKKSDSLLLNNNKTKFSISLPNIFSSIKEKEKETDVFISHSIYYYIKSLDNEIMSSSLSIEEINELKKKINPYGCLIEKDFLINKIENIHSEIFFNYIEIIKIANFFDIYTKQEITIHCLNTDIYEAFIFYNKSNNISYKVEKTLSKEKEVDMLCFEIDYEFFETYIFKFFSTLCKVLLHQSYNGNCIIKIGDIIYKPIINIIYIFSCLYEKVYILKPNASNVFNNERFLVCKNFRLENVERKRYYTYFNNLYLNIIIKKSELTKNFSIISNDIPN